MTARRWPGRVASVLAVVLVSVFLSGTAQAQSGSISTPVERAVAGQTVILERFTPPPVTGEVDLTVVDQQAQIDMVAASKIRVRLQSLVVDGVRSVSPDRLQSLWQDRIGKDVTLADIYRIADAVDAAYLAAGYFSMTVVPVQDFSTGRIRLRVYEGYVQRVEIESDIPGIEARLAPYIDRILAMRPIRVKEAERILLLMSDIGGLEIDGTFVRPEQPTGGGLLRLNIGQSRRSGMVGLDNLGSESVGPLELALSYQMNDLFRRFETTDIVGVTVPDDPEEMVFLQFSQEYPIWHDGLSAGYSFSYVRQHPGGSLADDDIDVASVIGTAFLAYPFLRSQEQSLFGRAEVSVRNDDVDVAGDPVSEGRTRWAEFSLQYDRAFETGFLSTVVGVNLGTASDIDMGDVPGNFRFVTAGLDYIRPLGELADLRIRAAGQYAAQALPGAVRFSVGGDPYGWAFDDGTISGDSGAATAIDLAHDFDTGISYLPGVSLAVFADYGRVWDHGTGGSSPSESLGSWGLGLSGMLGERISLQLIASRPWITPDEFDDPNRRLLFRLAVPL